MSRLGCTSQARWVCPTVSGLRGRRGCPRDGTRVEVGAPEMATYGPGSPWGGSRNSPRLENGDLVSESFFDSWDSPSCGPTRYGPAMGKGKAACAAESDTAQPWEVSCYCADLRTLVSLRQARNTELRHTSMGRE